MKDTHTHKGLYVFLFTVVYCIPVIWGPTWTEDPSVNSRPPPLIKIYQMWEYDVFNRSLVHESITRTLSRRSNTSHAAFRLGGRWSTRLGLCLQSPSQPSISWQHSVDVIHPRWSTSVRSLRTRAHQKKGPVHRVSGFSSLFLDPVIRPLKDLIHTSYRVRCFGKVYYGLVVKSPVTTDTQSRVGGVNRGSTHR